LEDETGRTEEGLIFKSIAMDTSNRDVPEYYEAEERPAPRNQALKVVIIVALVLVAGLWIWKAIQVASVRKEARQENERVRQTAENIITETRAVHLQLLSKPFVWAVRSEMLRGNMEGVNLYLQDMVKEKNFERIQVADIQGIVVASTDKKTEGKPLTEGGGALAVDSTMITKVGDSAWVVTSPIMGFNNRLGTLVIDYAAPKAKL
jgi:hypothetical protein